MHRPDRTAGISRSQLEVEAELGALIVCTAAGLDSSDYSLPYVAARSGGDNNTNRRHRHGCADGRAHNPRPHRPRLAERDMTAA
jgi:hypothetical protein